MDIFGIGTDIVECVRILKMIERHGESFLRRAFTDREINYCNAKQRSTEHFAGRWAAKEAIFRCLGAVRSKGLARTELEIRDDDFGNPVLHVGGAAKELLRELRIANILISIAHSRSFATAHVLALRQPGKKQSRPKSDEDTNG